MSLSNLIKNFLNIQDDNISFPEEEYCQVTQKGDYRIKVFKGFLKSNYCACPHCSSKNIVKNGSRHRKIKYIPIQNYNIELELTILVRIVRKLSLLLQILSVITLIYLIILSILLLLNLKKMYHLHILLRNMIFLLLLCKEL